MINTFDIPTVLEALGIDFDVRANEASALCPMHIERTGKADHSPSWWINLDTGMHMCFSCHYKGNIPQLVCDVKKFYANTWGVVDGYDYAAANNWLATVSDVTPERLLELLENMPKYVEAVPKPLEMSEARLAVFTEPPPHALKARQITAEAAKAYSVLWESNKQTWILPLRDPHFSKLMGWQEKGTIERTFFNRPAGLQKSKTLFGIENQDENMVIVVESPLDCVRIASAGLTSAVAICGSSPSEEQIKLIRYSKKVIAAFDNPNLDKAGLKASKEMLAWDRKYNLNLSFFNYGSSGKKDPGDMTDEEIRWGVENAISALYGESAYVQGNPQTVSS